MDWEIVSGYQILLNYEDNVYTTIINKQMSSITGITYSGEKNSQYITFIMDRYYDGIDLSSKLINICYKIEGTQNGGSDAPINVYRNNNQIKFGWIIPYACTANANTISLGVLVVGTEYGQDYIFKTNTSKYSITQGFISGNGIIEPDDNWFEQFLIQYNTNATNKILEYNNNANSKLGDFNNLSDRLDALNTELIDIRVGAYGKTYATSGDAVRGQITDLGNYIGYFPNNVVGLHADFQNMEFDRLAGAKSLTMGADFNKFNMYGGRKRCLLADDGIVIAYNDGTKYICNDTNGTIITLENGESGLLTTEVTVGGNVYPIGTQIQVMVEQPKFYYKVVPIKLDKQTDGVGYHLRSVNYYVSDYEYYGFKLHPCFYNESGNEVDYIYLSAYEGCAYDVSNSIYLTRDEQVVDFGVGQDKISSIANTKPMSGLTQQCTRQNVEQIAKNRGNGWHSLTIKSMSAEQLLMFIEMGGFNSQTNITNGVVSVTDNSAYNCSSLTGSTQNLANGIGQATSTINEINGTQTTYTNNGRTSICYRGVENDWGNIWKLVYGINIYGDGSQKGGIPYICKDYNFAESKNSDNYESAEFTLTNMNGYISAFGYSENFDYLFLPSKSLGNSNLPIGDYEYISSDLNGYKIALLGGRWNGGSSAGLVCWHLSIGVGVRSRDVVGRLMYVPQ